MVSLDTPEHDPISDKPQLRQSLSAGFDVVPFRDWTCIRIRAPGMFKHLLGFKISWLKTET